MGNGREEKDFLLLYCRLFYCDCFKLIGIDFPNDLTANISYYEIQLLASPPFLTAHIVSRWIKKKEISINNKQLKVRHKKKKKHNNFNFEQFVCTTAHINNDLEKNEPVLDPFYRVFLIPILSFSIPFSFLYLFFINITRVMCWLRDFFFDFWRLEYFFHFIIDFAAAL